MDGTDYPSEMMTLDKNNNLIYYDRIKNEINKITIIGNKVVNTEILLNMNSATYTAMEDNSAVTYKNLKINQIFWDNVKNRLIISGRFESIDNSGKDGWTNNSFAYSTNFSGFFTLENGNLKFLHKFPGVKVNHMYSDECNFILCAMNNGDYVVSGSHSTHIWNPELNTSTCLTAYVAKIFEQNGQDLYMVGNSDIRKYNYASQDTEEITKTNAAFNEAYFQNGIFYLWNYEGLTAYKTNGQSKSIFTTKTDVDVKDMATFPRELSYFCFVVTTDEKFIFYDSFAKSIRIIYPNPDNK